MLSHLETWVYRPALPAELFRKKTHQDWIFFLSLQDFHHLVPSPDSWAEAQRSQEASQEEVLQPGQSGEEEEADWKTTGGAGGSAGGLQ